MSAPYAYCTFDRVQNILSAVGASLRLDDMPPGQYGDADNQAFDEIDEACWQYYSQAQLQSSDWVATHAATLWAWYLCTRRGNPVPDGLQLRVDMTRDKLAKIRTHQLRIPRLAQLKSYAPVMSNMTTHMRPFPRATVEKTRSTGTPANYEDAKSRDPADKLGLNEILDWSI
jgi:hypothetical protein